MEEQPKNHWRTAGLILIGALIGYLIGRFAYNIILPPEADESIRMTSDVVSEENTETTTPQIQEISIDDDPFIGSNAAEVVIVDFSDYQCPFCKKFYTKIYPEMKKDYINTGKIKYVFRDYPLTVHKEAIAAAMAANCAGDQGRYWEMHDKLFENQTNWNKAENINELLIGYAKELGINSTLFSQCMESDKYLEEIQKDKEEGISYGVFGTPTLFLNGKILRGGLPQSYEAFQDLLEREYGI